MKTNGVRGCIDSHNLDPGERAPGILWIGDWVGPRAGVDDVEKRKFFTPQDLNSGSSVVQPISSRCTDYSVPAP
jgi:hypothetical protein